MDTEAFKASKEIKRKWLEAAKNLED